MHDESATPQNGAFVLRGTPILQSGRLFHVEQLVTLLSRPWIISHFKSITATITTIIVSYPGHFLANITTFTCMVLGASVLDAI